MQTKYTSHPEWIDPCIEHIENIILKPNDPNMQTHSLLATTTFFPKHNEMLIAENCCAVKLNAIASSDTWLTDSNGCILQSQIQWALDKLHVRTLYNDIWHTQRKSELILIDGRLSQRAHIRGRIIWIFLRKTSWSFVHSEWCMRKKYAQIESHN